VKRVMVVMLFLLVMAFVVRGPGQTLGEGIGQSVGNAGHFVSRVMTFGDEDRR
jgi:predicted small secreted protein